MPAAPAMAQDGDEEPSRRRRGESLEPGPVLEAPVPPAPVTPGAAAPVTQPKLELAPPVPRPAIAVPAPKPAPAPESPESPMAAPVSSEGQFDPRGLWKSKNFDLRLELAGQEVTAVIVRPSALASSQYGYQAGGVMFVGVLEGATIKGDFRGRFTLISKAECPDQWEFWDPFELTLSGDGKQLRGRRKVSRVHWPGCRIEDKGWKKYSLTRIGPEAKSVPEATATVSPPNETAKPAAPPAPPAKKLETVPAPAKPAAETETARLLREGWVLLAAKKLTTPKGRAAIGRFRQVLAIDPGNAEAKQGIAKIALTYRQWGSKASEREDYAKAEGYLVKSVVINGKDATAYAILGHARLNLGKYQFAREAFERALEIQPGNADYHEGIGQSSLGMGDYGAAVKAYEHVVAKWPDYAGPHRALGAANEVLGNWRPALENFSKAYAIDPEPGLDDYTFGRLYVRLKEYDKAVPHLKRAAAHYPDDPGVFDYLATAHHYLDNMVESLAAVRTRNRLEKQEASSGTAQPYRDESMVITPFDQPPPKRGRKPLTGIAKAWTSFDDGRYASAFYEYTTEAENGNPEAAYMLGRMHHQGFAVGRNLAKAFEWYLTAARAGHAGGQTGAGYMYYRGLGGAPRDRALAAQWFTKAAEGGVSGAMARLGQMYEQGDGVTKSNSTASYWLVKAGQLGNKAARKRLRELGLGSNTAIFAAPDEIDSDLGELPILSTP